MFFKEVLVDLLDGFLLRENPTPIGLQMVVVIIASKDEFSLGLAIEQRNACTPSSSTLLGCLRTLELWP